MRVCVIWQEIPEECRTYVFDASGKALEHLKGAHGTMIGANANKHTDWLSYQIGRAKSIPPNEVIGPVDMVVVTGSYM